MEQAIQILTIVIDGLLIFFILLLIALAWKSLRVVKSASGFVENLSDLKFWFSILKSIPKSFNKSKDKE